MNDIVEKLLAAIKIEARISMMFIKDKNNENPNLSKNMYSVNKDVNKLKQEFYLKYPKVSKEKLNEILARVSATELSIMHCENQIDAAKTEQTNLMHDLSKNL